MIKLKNILLEVYSPNDYSLNENSLTDLFKSVRTYGLKNAVLGNAGPPLGTSLLNGFKSGAVYKPNKKGEVLFSKEVSWYEPDKVPGLAKQLDTVEREYEKALSNLITVKKQLAKNLGTVDVEKIKSGDGKSQVTKTPEIISNHKEYLEANLALMKAEGSKIYYLHKLELAMGAKDKQNPYGLSVPIWNEKGDWVGDSYDKKDLYKKHPKSIVDAAFTDKPIPMNTRIKDIQIWIADLEKQIKTGEKLTRGEEAEVLAQYFMPPEEVDKIKDKKEDVSAKPLKNMNDEELDKSLEDANEKRMYWNGYKTEKPEEAAKAFLVYAEHKLERLMRARKKEKNPEQSFFDNTSAMKKLGIKSAKDIKEYPNLETKIGMSSEDLLSRYNKYVNDMYRADEELAGWQDAIKKKTADYNQKYETPYKSVLK